MKTPYLTILARLTLLPLALLLYQSGSAAVNFTVTPAATSNTYSGFITLQMTGLFTNETVLIQKYIDINANGVVDVADALVQQFQVTDGQGPILIGGVTNINIPYDSNPANGSITAQLRPIAEGIGQRYAGQYLYVFSSPSNHFTASNKLFSVTNFPFGQSFSGTVKRTNGTAIPYAVVLLSYRSPAGEGNFNPYLGAVANGAGLFTVKAPPGTYQLVAFGSNAVTDFARAPVIALTAGINIPTNLALVDATATISGKIVDANNPQIGLPGVTMAAIFGKPNSLLGIGSTDSNGNFKLPVISAQWRFGVDQTALGFLGYVGLDDITNSANTSTGSVSGVIIKCPKANALFYGTVRDNLGNPLPGVSLEGRNGRDYGPYQGDAGTDQNGNYAMGLVAGGWDIEVENSHNRPELEKYLFPFSPFSYNGGGNGTNISAQSAVKQDFMALLATNQITGFVRSNNVTPLAGVQVEAHATINGAVFRTEATTAANGRYTNYVANGTWDLNVNCCLDCDSGSLPPIYRCPDSQTVTIFNNNTNVNFSAVPFGTFLSGRVVDNLGNPVTNIVLYGFGSSFSEARTDGNGYYQMGVSGGDYTVQLNTGGSDGIASRGLCSPSVQVTITEGVNATLNLVAQRVTGTITASITNSSSQTGVGGIDISASTSTPLNGTNYTVGGQQTDASGRVVLPVCNASWYVNADCYRLSMAGFSCPGGAEVTIPPSNASVNFTVVPCGALQILTTALPLGTIDSYYDFCCLQAQSCNQPFWWSWSGNTPPGLNLDSSTGEIYNYPNMDGTFCFTVQVQDGQGNTTSTNLCLTVVCPLQITTVCLPNGTQSVFYSSSLSATCGQPPYQWSLEDGSGPLPAGLNLAPNGLVSGTPGELGTIYFIALVTDAAGNLADQTVCITIVPAPLRVATTNLPDAIVGLPYSANLGAMGGQPPYSWSLRLGSAPLPPGLHLDPDGLISGTPTRVGRFSLIAQVNDSNGASASTNVIIRVKPMLFSPVRVSPTRFQFRLLCSTGTNYTLQYSTTLTNWNFLLLTNPVSTNVLILDSNATNQHRYYRAMVGP